jgi:uncharacterized protein
VFRWFRERFWAFDLSFPPMGIAQSTARRIRDSDTFRFRVVQLMRDADFGIAAIDVVEKPFPSLPDDAPENLRSAIGALRQLLDKDSAKMLAVSTYHAAGHTGEPVPFSLEDDESNGTQRFFAIAGPILDALDKGALLLVDELDCSMHPLLTRKVIELFQSPRANTNGSQLVFATHDSSVMDSSIFRRDQVWLTEKRQDGSTDLFSLHDFDHTTRPRKGEALERRYLAGRYGAVPQFGPIFEDLELR